VANFLVTADVSGWASVSYFGVPPSYAPIATMGLIGLVGALNWFGPKHSGSVSIWLAVPTVITVVAIIAVSLPHLTTKFFEAPHSSFGASWVAFVGVILALSGVEAVANITGVMKLDPGATPAKPSVRITATRSILPVAVEVVLGTVLLGWAMLSLPGVMQGSPEEISAELLNHKEDMLRLLGDKFGAATVAPWFGIAFGVFVGVMFGLLLFSAVNTAVVALIGVLYMMALDGDMPRPMTRLNRHGVPTGPLFIAVLLPILVLTVTKDFERSPGCTRSASSARSRSISAPALSTSGCRCGLGNAASWVPHSSSFSSWSSPSRAQSRTRCSSRSACSGSVLLCERGRTKAPA
jgi:amino acid transporter